MKLSNLFERAFTATVVLLLLIYYLKILGWVAVPDTAISAVAALCCATGLGAGRRMGAKLFAVALLGLGAALHFSADHAPGDYLAGFTRMVAVVPLITLLPVAGFLFSHRAYGPTLTAWASQRIRSPRGLHGAIWGATHLISAVVTMGALPVMYALFGKEAQADEEAGQFLATASLRGYTTSAFWTPNATAVAIGTHFTGASIASVLPLGFLMTAVAAWVNWVQVPGSGGRLGARLSEPPLPLGPAERSRVAEFLAVLTGFLGALVVADQWTSIGLIALAPLAALLLTLVGFAALGAMRTLAGQLSGYVATGLPPKSSEIALVLAVGFFTTGLEASPFGSAVLRGLQDVLAGRTALVMLALPLLVVALGFCGVTPTVALLFVTGVLDASALGVAAVSVVGALCLGQVVGLAITPVALPLFLLAGLAGSDPITVGWRWNWRYALLLFAAGQGVLQAWAAFV